MAYPASVTVESPERIANWRPLVHWLLLIPHLIIFEILQHIAWLLNLFGWLAIVLTGKLPKGLADFQSMYLRYSIRLYAYFDFLHERYPPFAFDMPAPEPGDTPVAVDIEPQLTDRWPDGMRGWVVSWFGVNLRMNAYLHLLTDEYPPFSLDA